MHCSVASTIVLKNSPIFSKKCQIHANSDVKGKIEFFITNSDSTLQIYMKFAFIVTCSVFLDSEWITDNVRLVWQNIVGKSCLANAHLANYRSLNNVQQRLVWQSCKFSELIFHKLMTLHCAVILVADENLHVSLVALVGLAGKPCQMN